MKRLVVVGHGMVGHRFLESTVRHGLTERFAVTLVGEEPRPAYDRVHLSAWFEGSGEEDLRLCPDGWLAEHGIAASLGCRAVAVDTGAKAVTTEAGEVIGYDELVLATGSTPFVPPLPGVEAAGVFVYRTIDDLVAIDKAATGATRGVVLGGGLLGLEAANALRLLGLETHVVEVAPRLMAVQLDEGGAKLLRRKIEDLGIRCHVGVGATAILTDAGECRSLQLADGRELPADLVVVAAGIRPRDDLAGKGLERGERGGFEVDDTLATSAPNVWAIGECAAHHGRCYGLVAPGYQMAETLAARLAGDDSAIFAGADLSTKLKLVGVDVASFGDAHGATPGCQDLVWADPRAGVYKKLVLDAAGKSIIGGVLVGDTSAYGVLAEMAKGTAPTPRKPESLILPASSGAAAPSLKVTDLPDAAGICSCNGVSKGQICAAVRDNDLGDVGAIKTCTRAGTTCGSCVPLLKDLLVDELTKAGKTVTNHLCEHFPYSRQQLFDLVRVRSFRSFSALIAELGTGRGCEICKPAVASMFASEGNGYILDGEQAALQDTNDHALANLQKDGSYSVVPRVPGGEITPAQLIALGQVAQEFDLYTKITGGQRVDLFGARLDQLPSIWSMLISAGFESGHAYGKALRTVKSCVGSTWCRYGVQDSVALAVEIELRYRGLRAPHKFKSAVSGCARECAEAQSKDFGIIATEKGWNLYVCGNGGMRPQHATLLAEDLDHDTLIQLVDRFLIFYIRTADRLERTAPWFNKLEGGIDYLREVLIEDSLGICSELEAAMANHVQNYRCEWAETLADPTRLARFVSFVNAPDEVDTSLVYIRERGQKRPAPAPSTTTNAVL